MAQLAYGNLSLARQIFESSSTILHCHDSTRTGGQYSDRWTRMFFHLLNVPIKGMSANANGFFDQSAWMPCTFTESFNRDGTIDAGWATAAVTTNMQDATASSLNGYGPIRKMEVDYSGSAFGADTNAYRYRVWLSALGGYWSRDEMCGHSGTSGLKTSALWHCGKNIRRVPIFAAHAEGVHGLDMMGFRHFDKSGFNTFTSDSGGAGVTALTSGITSNHSSTRLSKWNNRATQATDLSSTTASPAIGTYSANDNLTGPGFLFRHANGFTPSGGSVTFNPLMGWFYDVDATTGLGWVDYGDDGGAMSHYNSATTVTTGCLSDIISITGADLCFLHSYANDAALTKSQFKTAVAAWKSKCGLRVISAATHPVTDNNILTEVMHREALMELADEDPASYLFLDTWAAGMPGYDVLRYANRMATGEGGDQSYTESPSSIHNLNVGAVLEAGLINTCLRAAAAIPAPVTVSVS